ncbi:unnamed protein product [Nezara viridula]|uniref:SH3 domain-binding protein 5-like n=1 Tax=Nezara viridula TaxID=85310 RepID=A0A9P0MV79_NEZVI|nr:unnamed protein product [Nezara viridula]
MNEPSDKVRRSDYDRFDEQVDPRVQVELERLNTATDDINKLEVDLNEARTEFRQKLWESTVHLEAISKKLGSCIEKARPYYEARIKAKEALLETQKAASKFERANSAHAAAKEMVYLAEEGLTAEGRTFDHAWQEMLNHATMRVNESELDRTLSEADHKRTSAAYHAAEMKVQKLQKELKRSISKSRSYFESKAQFNKLLEEQKLKVKVLEKKVSGAKLSYSQALRNLEEISDEIHKSRKCRYSGMDPLGISNLSPDGTTGSSSTNQDSESSMSPEDEDEYLQLPNSLGISASPVVPYLTEYRKLEETVTPERSPVPEDEWTEISLSPEGKAHPPQPPPPPPPLPAFRAAQLPRRQSLDVIISGGIATGERVKEILEKGIMKLNISSLSMERRGSEPRLTRKAPSPLEKSGYLSANDQDSDTDSLTSVEMLSDEQISSLMLDQEIQEAYNDIFSQQSKQK